MSNESNLDKTSPERIDEIKTLALYQSAWNRFFSIKAEILRAEATAKARAEFHVGDLQGKASYNESEFTESDIFKEALERLYISHLTAALQKELQEISDFLEADKYKKLQKQGT